jgi:pilus assembly protein Flp/PilA
MNMFSYAINTVRALTTDKKGAAMVEYGLLVAFIALVALAGVTILGTDLKTLFTNIGGSL